MDGNPPPGPQASCRLALRANPTPLVDNHRKHHRRHPQKPCQETWMLDHLHELVNETVRKFPDHGDIRDNTRYSYRTVLENVSHLTPEVLEKVSQLVAESGHAMVRKSKSDGSFAGPLRFVRGALPDGRQPAVGCDALSGARPRSRARGGGGSGSIGAAGSAFRRFDRPGGGGWYLDDSRELERKRRFRHLWRRASRPSWFSRSYLEHARRQIDQVDRRLRREDPAGREGVFDLRGALVREGQVPVELGVPVAVLEDQHGFLLHHRILWEGSDMDHAVPMIRAVSIAGSTVPPTGLHWTSCWTRCRRRESLVGRTGKLTRHSGRCADSIRPWSRRSTILSNAAWTGSCGADGFARMVALSMVAFNVHRLLLHRRARRRRKHAA